MHLKVDSGLSHFAKWLNRPEKEAASLLRNGRIVSIKTETAAEDAPWLIAGAPAKFVREDSKGRDGYLIVEGKKFATSVRTMGMAGVKFQMSKFIGSGRSCSVADLIYSLNQVKYFIVVHPNDKTLFCYLIESSKLLKEVKAGRLGPQGWTADEFSTWYHKVYDVTEEPAVFHEDDLLLLNKAAK